MSRSVRNFWVEVEIDGQKTKLSGGPKSKDGGIDINLKYRKEGSIADEEITVRGVVKDGKLYIHIIHDDEELLDLEVDR